MGIDYASVLHSIGLDFEVVGRGPASAEAFTASTGRNVFQGGIKQYIAQKIDRPTHAIVAVGIESLCDVTIFLLEWGVKNILVEKPAGLTKSEVQKVLLMSKGCEANVFVAYNRRFYSSVLKAQEIIAADGGVTSFSFEFTEWSHVIEKIRKAPGVKEHWVLGNSSHVLDMAFYLGGKPKILNTITSGALAWHPAASIFCGSGISDIGALFCYHANWESAGNWRLEVSTRSNRILFQPLERLKIQKKGTITLVDVECDSELDEKFKPGLYLQVHKFVTGEFVNLCSISEHASLLESYYEIAGY